MTQDPGAYQPYPPPAPPPGRPPRPRWRTVLGWIFIGLTILIGLGVLSGAAQGTFVESDGGGAEMVGMLIGLVLGIGIPLTIGLLLLRRPKH